MLVRTCTVVRLLAVVASLLGGAATALEHDVQGWSVFVAQGRATPWLRWYGEVQPRLGERITRLDRVIMRPAVGVQVTSYVSVWLGYAWTRQFGPQTLDEHRVFQQLLVEHAWGQLSLINRTRFEQRFIEASGGVSLRLRHQVRVVWRFTPTSRWGLVAAEELFVNLNAVVGAPAAGFDQNRALLGVNWKAQDPLQLELGYMNNFVNRPLLTEDRMNHIVRLAVTATL
ncbi:MAG: DUF2490 domain-containing protein [Myxococcaceae bacterium]